MPFQNRVVLIILEMVEATEACLAIQPKEELALLILKTFFFKGINLTNFQKTELEQIITFKKGDFFLT